MRAAVAALQSYGIHPQSLRQLSNWLQLARFCIVGSCGYVVNLTVFALATDAGVYYALAAVVAFVFAVTNNFVLNRIWTFDASDGAYATQAIRYLVVSLVGLGANLLLLTALVASGVTALAGQATAILLLTPLTFMLNKRWSFGS